MNLYKEYKTHTLLAIIAALFVTYCFEPFINFISKFFFLCANFVSSTYLDSLYVDIARGKTDYALILTSILFFAIVILVLKVPKIIKSSLKNKSFVSIKHQKSDNQAKNEVESDTLISEPHNIKENSALAKLVAICMTIIFLSICLFAIASSHIKYSTILMFDQQIKILTPYISSEQKDLLISKFSAMKSYEDYKTINLQLNNFAQNNKIELPKQSYLLTW